MAQLYVGVAIHGCRDYVAPCLESLLSSELDFPTHFIFLDNGSPNPTEILDIFNIVKAKYGDVLECYKSAINKGCAGGWNFCIQKALADPECKWVILAGHDIVVHPRTLSNLVHRYLRGGVDITSGVDAVYDADLPTPEDKEVPGANFSLILLPRKVIETVGLFDENFWPAYFEDNDYHYRAILAGCGNGVWTWLAPFRHARSSTIRTYPQLLAQSKSAAYFIQKWGGLPNEVLQNNETLRIACEREDLRRSLESGKGWKGENTMFVLCIPALDTHDLTHQTILHLNETVVDKNGFIALVVDNDSEVPYDLSEFSGTNLRIEIIRNTENKGNFYPLLQADMWVKTHFPSDRDHIVGVMHNDVFIYEKGWDLRVRDAFWKDEKLGALGFCGSNEVCERGGRGGGTMCYFDGRAGQSPNTGRRIIGLHPALIFDALCMIFRSSVLPILKIDDSITLMHFYDRIWPLRLVDAGYHVAVLGVQIDHVGGRTSPKHNIDAAKWCKKYGIPYNEADIGSAGHAVYLEAERRMFEEFAPKGLIPSFIDANYNVTRFYNRAKWPDPSPYKKPNS
jgi:GT2 family glycosyltransferase